MHGVSGSGKSTVAQQFAKDKGAVILKADAIRKHITGTPLIKSDAAIYDKATSDLVYTFLNEQGVCLIDTGFDVVLDATFLDVKKRQEVLSFFQGAGVDVKILSVECSKGTAMKRIDARVGDVSDATNEILKIQLEKFLPLTEQEKMITQVINND
jgi:predicted kinase